MKVKLLTSTPNMLDVVYTSARTCYNAGSPIDMWFDVCTIPTDKKLKLVDKVLSSGHGSTTEHVCVTFAIEGIDRATTHQLVRHRTGISYSQQSQRYVEIKESREYLENLFTSGNYTEDYQNSELCKILNKYFVDGDKFKNVNGYYYALDNYLEAIERGEKPEDARRFLPNHTRTNIVVTVNLRELIHLCGLRLCTRAQLPIRQMVKAMRDELVEKEPWLDKYLQPKCVRLGFCEEDNCCGRKPTLEQLLDKGE